MISLIFEIIMLIEYNNKRYYKNNLLDQNNVSNFLKSLNI